MIPALLLAVSLGTLVDAQPTGRVIVEFSGAQLAKSAVTRQATEARFRRDAEATGAHVRHQYTVTFFGASVDASPSQVTALQRLPYVRSVHPAHKVEALATAGPAAPTALISDAGTRVDSLSLPTRGEGIRVAVIDTGIDYTHPALGGAFGPGHKVAGGWDFVNDDADPFDDNGHGTHVSGIIAADSDSLQGVAPHATLYGFKVLDAGGSGSSDDVMAGIEAAADPNGDGDPSDHLDVANLSLGGLGGADDPQSLAVDGAVAAGVVVCVAAGNSGGFAIISSPGSSPSAITVGAIDDTGAMASFSSRGPDPGDLQFKPDVVAPGVNIISSIAGGGTRSLSGTSMATPHVTGVCALLRALHPDWTPGDVKSALTSTATTIAGTPVDRGAGRVDALLASAATIVSSDSGLSFGIDAASGSTFDATRTVTITNRSAQTATVGASSPAVSGVTTTINPTSATLAAGASQAFAVRVSADNTNFGYPAGKIVAGSVDFTGGGKTLHVPWVIVRSARVTITYTDLGGVAFGYMPQSTAATFVYPYADDRAEAYVTPGKVWDFLVSGRDPDPAGSNHFHLLETNGHTIDGDDTISLGPADSPYELTLAALDPEGNRLSTLPSITGHRRHSVIMDLVWRGKPNGEITFIIGAAEAIDVSALPSIGLTVYETYMDLDQGRFFAITHDAVQDAASSMTLTKDESSYSHSRWTWTPTSPADSTFTACAWLLHRGTVEVTRYIGLCMDRELSAPFAADAFITPEGTADFPRALTFATPSAELPLLRAADGSMFLSADAAPGPLAFRVANGGVTAVGIGPVCPTSMLHGLNGSGKGGFIGPLGETRSLDGSYWRIVDPNGNERTSGQFPGTPLPTVVARPGDSVEVTDDLLRIAGRTSHGNLRLSTATTIDFTPPTLTSMRIYDADGNLAEQVANGAAATLRFAAADRGGQTTAAPLQEATKVAWRLEGTTEWHDVTPTVESEDTGDEVTAGRHLAGDLYRADLAAATTTSGLIDLRIDLEDAAGNHMTWTQSPAFVVGGVPPSPRRHPAR
ncbi:MAG TPA: S8 family serine peptidase [Thermoanaerobaculia bacterium]|nr:S8 family serine peptidase [Thermoanaerobaculia bacterium]